MDLERPRVLPDERRPVLLRDEPLRREELFRADRREEEERRDREPDPLRADADLDDLLRPLALRPLLRDELLRLERVRDPLLRDREFELDLRAAMVCLLPASDALRVGAGCAVNCKGCIRQQPSSSKTNSSL